MEVDRIWRIDGLDGKANPAWQTSARRRRFVEEVPTAEEEPDASEEESAAQDQPSGQDRTRISIAGDDTADSSASSDDSDASFRVIA